MSEQCIVRIMAPNERWYAALPDINALTANVVERAVAASGKVHSRSEVSVVFSDDRELRLLNQEHRGIDQPTNVLSFPGEPLDEEAEQGAYTIRVRPLVLGDVVLAFETTEREAQEQGKSLEHHLAHLLVHGVLHLCGFDHARDADGERMENLERRILSDLGIADPYQPKDEEPRREEPKAPERRLNPVKKSVVGKPATTTARAKRPPAKRKTAAVKRPAAKRTAAKKAASKNKAAKNTRAAKPKPRSRR